MLIKASRETTIDFPGGATVKYNGVELGKTSSLTVEFELTPEELAHNVQHAQEETGPEMPSRHPEESGSS